ncbi:MAG: ABC transporter ATP-binding protein [Alphaproteobacteria bacterium]
MTDPLLRVEGLATHFRTDRGTVRAVDGVSFTVARGRTVGVVGESGCGKSVTALSIMGLVPPAPAATVTGRVMLDGEDLLALPLQRLQDIRGDRIAMVFQEPMTSLNPAFPVGAQIAEAIVRHRGVGHAEARLRTIELLRRVRIPAPEQRYDEYPHKLSGGMRQRVMIALALACDPEILIADEPTTALDVTIQAQILDLLRRLRAETGMAIVLITHDLGVVAEMADEVIVMYAGRIVERAPVERLFAEPQHPYTIGLMGSIPQLHLDQDRLAAIEGQVPSPAAPPAGCRFHPRCPFVEPACRADEPALDEIAPGHAVACRRAPLGAEAAAA